MKASIFKKSGVSMTLLRRCENKLYELYYQKVENGMVGVILSYTKLYMTKSKLKNSR